MANLVLGGGIEEIDVRDVSREMTMVHTSVMLIDFDSSGCGVGISIQLHMVAWWRESGTRSRDIIYCHVHELRMVESLVDGCCSKTSTKFW